MSNNNNGKTAYEIRLEELQAKGYNPYDYYHAESAHYNDFIRIKSARPDEKGPYELPEDKRVRDL